jgi:choline kinase
MDSVAEEKGSPVLKPIRKKSLSSHSARSQYKVRASFRRRSSDSGGSSSEYDPTDTVPHVSRSLDRSLRGDAFKKELLVLLHKLEVTQWRSVPAETAHLLSVRRISGALTNSIYKITLSEDAKESSEFQGLLPRNVPTLLLRLYGAHVEYLIDRTNELAMLKRLSRYHIGPVIFGTFTNGRFEQWLDSHTIDRLGMRDSNLSCSIARRMRELHDGVKLSYSERRSPPSVWQSLDKWLPRARDIIAQRQKKSTGRLSHKNLTELARKSKDDFGETTDLILGQKWTMFELALGRYRLHMEEQYPLLELKHDLAFCHNDVISAFA